MKKIVNHHTTLRQALRTLDNVIAYTNTAQITPDFEAVLYDATMQRFKYCYELTWQYIKKYLKQRGIIVKNPKTAFQKCWKQHIINEQEMQTLLDMTIDRKIATHPYQEKLAVTISNKIPTYAKIMTLLAHKTAPEKISQINK